MASRHKSSENDTLDKALTDEPSLAENKETDENDEEYTDIQRSIVAELKNGRLHADEICRRLDMDSAELMTELTELEIMGAVRSLPGKMYELYR